MLSAVPRPRISVVIPMLNEEHGIAPLLARTFDALGGLGERFEVICIDDGSTDGTLRVLEEEALRRAELRVLSLARNFGQHAAIIAGFDASAGDWIITLDADLQNPPEEIPRIVEEFRRGHDLIGTYRQGRQDTLFRKAASWAVNRLMRKFSKIEIRDLGCMLRGYSRDVARAIASRSVYRTFIPALAALHAASPTEIPVSHARRTAGKSKYSLSRLVGLTLDLMTCFSLWPLRMLFVTGGVVCLTGIALGLFILAGRIFRAAAWPSEGIILLFSTVLFFVGGQLIAFGLLGEYVGRILHEVRDQPPYVLRKSDERGGQERILRPEAMDAERKRG